MLYGPPSPRHLADALLLLVVESHCPATPLAGLIRPEDCLAHSNTALPPVGYGGGRGAPLRALKLQWGKRALYIARDAARVAQALVDGRCIHVEVQSTLIIDPAQFTIVNDALWRRHTTPRGLSAYELIGEYDSTLRDVLRWVGVGDGFGTERKLDAVDHIPA